MSYLDKYPNCEGCPVIKYCGTMVGSIRLCNSYSENTEEEPTYEEEYTEEYYDLSDGDLYR